MNVLFWTSNYGSHELAHGLLVPISRFVHIKRYWSWQKRDRHLHVIRITANAVALEKKVVDSASFDCIV